MESQARYGAATTRVQRAPGPSPAGQATRPVGAAGAGQAATDTSHAITIGPHQAAAAYTRRGGHPRHHPNPYAPAATIVTGATAIASAMTANSRIPRHRIRR
jgi:hypothetical protein